MSEEKRYTVLAVDDQEGVLKTIDVMLHDSPFKLITATSGRAAMDQVDQEHVDVVLLDILMPEVSGITVAIQMRSHPRLKDVPIMMLTAANDYSVLRRAQKVGADDILLKPIGKKHLINKMMEVIDRRQAVTTVK
jgi:two-component system sensor histidine kinase/response regulator